MSIDPAVLTDLRFRPFQGASDYAVIASLIADSKDHDHVERSISVEDITHTYTHLVNCDPVHDLLFAEVNGQPVGYCRNWWLQGLDGPWLGFIYGVVHPAWRRKGIGGALLRHAEARLQQIAVERIASGQLYAETPRFATMETQSTEHDRQALLEKSGYQPVRYGNLMVRPNFEDIPLAPLPDGLEVRPVLPEHYRPIWDAAQEAFMDHWGYIPPTETDYQGWLTGPEFAPHLWQVAWDGEQVAGMVLNFVNEGENKEYQRKRGYTENISVRRPWRRHGLARALLVRSLGMFRDLGYTEACLGVDTQNLNQAFRLYEGVGFQVVQTDVIYRKPI